MWRIEDHDRYCARSKNEGPCGYSSVVARSVNRPAKLATKRAKNHQTLFITKAYRGMLAVGRKTWATLDG